MAKQKFYDYFNSVLNDNRIFSYQDVVGLTKSEGDYYKQALSEQYDKIGYPCNSELAKSNEAVYVRAYTREDGTQVRAHYRSKDGHRYKNPDKQTMPNYETGMRNLKRNIDNWLKTRERNRNYREEDYKYAQKPYNNYDNDSYTAGYAADANTYKEQTFYDENADTLLKEIGRQILKTENGYYLQAIGGKSTAFLDQVSKKTPLSNIYYNLSLDPDKAKKNDEFIKTKVSSLKNNKHLYAHVKKLASGIDDDTMFVVALPNSQLVNTVKDSDVMKDTLSKYKKDIKNNRYRNSYIPEVSFYGQDDLATLLGAAHIYNPHIDNEGNLIMQIPDYYDFKKRAGDDLVTVINNNAYKQQENNMLTNYVLLVPIKYTPEEQKHLLGW